jgi:trk system potassium uptake protein TrkH
MGMLIAVVIFSFLVYFFNENTSIKKYIYVKEKQNIRIFYRARFASITALPFLLTSFIFYHENKLSVLFSVAICCLIPGIIGVFWAKKEYHRIRAWIMFVSFIFTLVLVILAFNYRFNWLWISLLWPIINIVLLPSNLYSQTDDYSWFMPLFNHPARLLVSTFLGLIVLGTLMLMLPIASSTGQWIPITDAAFTSVSAVCVTGLIVLDTPVDFSFVGQFFILFLIQAGGLGIMTIATIALPVLKKLWKRLLSGFPDSVKDCLRQDKCYLT